MLNWIGDIQTKYEWVTQTNVWMINISINVWMNKTRTFMNK